MSHRFQHKHPCNPPPTSGLVEDQVKTDPTAIIQLTKTGSVLVTFMTGTLSRRRTGVKILIGKSSVVLWVVSSLDSDSVKKSQTTHVSLPLPLAKNPFGLSNYQYPNSRLTCSCPTGVLRSLFTRRYNASSSLLIGAPRRAWSALKPRFFVADWPTRGPTILVHS